MRRAAPLLLAVCAVLGAACEPALPVSPGSSPAPTRPASMVRGFQERFEQPDGLVTNEFATWNPTSPGAVRNPAWRLTSGTLFARGGAGWSGVPDQSSPDAGSRATTGSAVFRLLTNRQDFTSVRVRFSLRVDRLVTTSRTPAVDWDGVHVFLRYRSEEHLYYASVDRRDGSLAVKKKCPGGATNGGTYVTLASSRPGSHPIPFGSWQQIATSVVDNPDGSVTIRIFRDGQRVLEAVDRGALCAPIRGGGAVGIRGDNAELTFDDFVVKPA